MRWSPFARRVTAQQALADLETTEDKARIRSALARIPALEGGDEAVERIVEVGTVGAAPSGQYLIRSGDHDEDVYF